MIASDNDAQETLGAPDMTLIFLLNMSASWMSPSSMTSGLTTTRDVSGVTNWYLSESRRARSRLLHMMGSAGAPSSS